MPCLQFRPPVPPDGSLQGLMRHHHDFRLCAQEDAHLTSVLEDLRTANGWSTIADVDWREVSARVDDR